MMQPVRWLGPVAMVLALALHPASSAGAPITFNTALPVAQGEFVFRQLFTYGRASRDPTGLSRSLKAFSSTSVLVYGITSDLAIFGAIPYFDRRMALNAGGGRTTRSAAGLGDIRLFGRYTIYKLNLPGRSFRIAPIAGIEMPSGEHGERDRLGRLPAGLQLGSGSWDPFFGVVATYQTLDFQIDAEAGYQANTPADGFEFGDVLRLNASLQVRLWPRELKSDIPGFFYGILEANLVHQRRNRLAGASDPNSGGTRLFLVPGLQYVTRRWIIEAAVKLPVLQKLNGTGLKSDYTVVVGFRVNF